MPQIHIKNQLNNELTIEFCIADQEYTLAHEEKAIIDVIEDVNMYLDIVRK